MKKMKRLVCMLLILITVLSLIPSSAFAKTAEKKTITITIKNGNTKLSTYTMEIGNKKVELSAQEYITHKKKLYEFSHFTIDGKKTNYVTIPAYDGSDEWEDKWLKSICVIYKVHSHKFHPGFTRLYHWKICSCGHTTNEVRHVDPATDEDKICTCGYKFNNNADLVTLWLDNMQLSPNFNKETTEYIGNVITWKDVTSTKITANPFDALATVQLPENLEIHEGANRFEVVVTSEDTLVKKTYTVVAVKPVKVEDTLLGSDGKTLAVSMKAPVKLQIASAAVSETVGAKMVELAANDQCSQIALQPDFSKWGNKQVEITLPGTLLKEIAGKTTADLIVKTPYESTLTIPHGEIAPLAASAQTVVLCVRNDTTFAILADGTEIPVSEKITLLTPEMLAAMEATTPAATEATTPTEVFSEAAPPS